MSQQTKQLLLRAIEICGGKSELARACGLNSRQVIDNAVRRGSVSTDLALAIDRATNGAVKKEALIWGEQQPKRKAA